MTDVASLSLKVDSTQVKQADTALDGMTGAANQAQKAATNLNAAATKTTGSFGMMKGATSNLSFQLQDIAVQAQMGTSAFTILAQQGPQIASVFGPGGAVFGAVIGVAAAIGGVLFTSMQNLEEQTNKTTDRLKELKDELNAVAEEATGLAILDFNMALVETGEELDEAIKKMNELRAAVNLAFETEGADAKLEESLAEQQRLVDLLRAKYEGLDQSLTRAIKGFKEEEETLTSTERARIKRIDRVEELIKRYKQLGDTVGMTRAETIRYNAAVQAQNATTEEQKQRLLEAAEAYAKNVEEQERLREQQKETAKEIKLIEKEQNKLTDSISSGLERAIQDYKNFGDVVKGVLEDIAATLLKRNVTDPLVSALGGFDFMSLFGGGPSIGQSSAASIGNGFTLLASGGIVNEPTHVGMSGGKPAIAGEAGPEAVLPLRRGSGGNLGVIASGVGGSNVVVNVNNQSGGEATASESQGPSGERIIDVTVQQAVNRGFASGAFDRGLRTNFGLNRQGT